MKKTDHLHKHLRSISISISTSLHKLSFRLKRTPPSPSTPQAEEDPHSPPLPPPKVRSVDDSSRHGKILHLGASESGKSTVLKSFVRTVDGDDAAALDNTKGISYRRIIFGNVIRSMQNILEEMERLDISLADSSNGDHVRTILAQPKLLLEEKTERLGKEVESAIQHLWKDGNVRMTLSRFRHDMYVDCPATDCAAYYFDSIERISQPDYNPSALDILYSHNRTTSITSTKLRFNNHDYDVFDVGGARNYRKTWIHCLQNLDVIIFTVDIASYDQVLYEDHTRNRMDEAFALFGSIVRSKFFIRVPLILVFTKLDLLERKLACSPPEKYFPDYEGGGGPSSADTFVSYITDRFVALNEQAEKKRLFVRYTSIHSSSGDDPMGPFLLRTIQDVVTDIDNVELRRSNFAFGNDVMNQFR